MVTFKEFVMHGRGGCLCRSAAYVDNFQIVVDNTKTWIGSFSVLFFGCSCLKYESENGQKIDLAVIHWSTCVMCQDVSHELHQFSTSRRQLNHSASGRASTNVDHMRLFCCYWWWLSRAWFDIDEHFHEFLLGRCKPLCNEQASAFLSWCIVCTFWYTPCNA